MRRTKESFTLNSPICHFCGEECDRELSPRIDAPLVDSTFPAGARFIFCTVDHAKQAIERKKK